MASTETRGAKRPREAVPPSPSSALAQLVGDPSSVFFDHHWETRPLRISGAHRRLTTWHSLPHWPTLLRLLHDADRVASAVILLKDQTPTDEYASAAEAYLDGCSVVVNHVERACGGIAALCKSLRDDVPHAFGNLYLTPPLGQAVDAHADDRDVLVVQLSGTKHWRLLGSEPPIAFPMSDEQVGKAGLAVPESALRGEVTEHELVEGDCLYIPRGWVHEARTGASEPSLHLTIALPTHDWCWAKVAAGGRVREQLGHEDCGPGRPSWFWRRSVPPALICSGAGEAATASARELAASVEVEMGLTPASGETRAAEARAGEPRRGGDVLARLFAERVAPHNRAQDADEARRAAATARETAASASASLSAASLVRRRREDDPPARARPEGREHGGGLRARAEIADALVASLGKVTADRAARVADFEPSPLLCDFGRACFAQVCVDAGLLVVCDEEGNAVGERE